MMMMVMVVVVHKTFLFSSSEITLKNMMLHQSETNLDSAEDRQGNLSPSDRARKMATRHMVATNEGLIATAISSLCHFSLKSTYPWANLHV